MAMIALSALSSMHATFVNPHRFGLACTLETERAIKIDRATVGGKYQLVELRVLSKKHPHHLAADPRR
jgi:hypothetical protein